jgi:hypothetical protein
MLAARTAPAAYFALRRRRQNELTLVTTGSGSRRCVSGAALSWHTANTNTLSSSQSAPTPPLPAGLRKGETSLFERIRLLESCGELSLAAAETVVTRHLATTTICMDMGHSRPDVERAFRY